MDNTHIRNTKQNKTKTNIYNMDNTHIRNTNTNTKQNKNKTKRRMLD